MGQQETIQFSLSSKLLWSVTSDDSEWLEKNITEFRSSKASTSVVAAINIEVKQVNGIDSSKTVVTVSEGISCSPESIYIKDKFSNKKIHFQISEQQYVFEVERGFTFHYYAAILDAIIKIIAFKKDILAIHASAIRLDNQVSVFAAWRRIGKTTIVLNLLKENKDIEILADDAVMLTMEREIIPYLRGIDLFPYLPIPQNYLGLGERIQRKLGKFLETFPILPKSIKQKVLKRFLLPRLNLAVHGHGIMQGKSSVDFFYILKKQIGASALDKISFEDFCEFVGRSSYFEIMEYQAIFEMACSIYPNSGFSELLVTYEAFQNKVNSLFVNSKILELRLSDDYSDLYGLQELLSLEQGI
ncbi:MAG: hypothetical protein AAF554_14205 [Bacteroidota bacterium]